MRGVPDLTSDFAASGYFRLDSPPAEGVAMADITANDESTLLLQILDDLCVGRLDMDALVVGHIASELARLVKRARRKFVLFDDTVGNGNTVIILTESGCLVNDTGTRGIGHVRIGNDSERSVLELLGEVVEHGRVSPANHVFTLEGANLFELGLRLWVDLLLRVVTFIHGGQKVLQEDEVLFSFEIVDFDVSEVGVDTEAQIGRQGPRCGGPCQ